MIAKDFNEFCKELISFLDNARSDEFFYFFDCDGGFNEFNVALTAPDYLKIQYSPVGTDDVYESWFYSNNYSPIAFTQNKVFGLDGNGEKFSLIKRKCF